jgi:hypothetical protein
MKTKVIEQGIIVPKKFLKGIKEVEIRIVPRRNIGAV